MLRIDPTPDVGLCIAKGKVTCPMNAIKRLYRDNQPGRHVTIRVFLAVTSLASFLLASGAGMHWC